jgi:hypothetical protein
MAYSLNLINNDGLVVFDPLLETYQVRSITVLAAQTGYAYDTGIPISPLDIILVTSTGAVATGMVWRGLSTLQVASTGSMKVLILTPVSTLGEVATGYGMNLYDNQAKLLFSTTRGIFRIDAAYTETPYGSLGATEYPRVDNVFSTPHLNSSVYLSVTMPSFVCARSYSSDNSNTAGFAINCTLTTVGFIGATGSSWGSDKGPVGQFSYMTGTLYV